MASVTIAGVVLTLNEEINIQRCLSSLSWCDELVVLDSGSDDRTCDLARMAGARVYEHRQPPPFRISEQRNRALTNTDLTSDWVLFLDADEVVPQALAEEVRRRCGSEPGVDAYRLAPKYMFMGRWMRHCMAYPAWHDRLLRRGATNFDGGVWEHYTKSVRIATIGEPYLHYGNSKGFKDWLERHDRYSSWDAAAIVEYLDGGGSTSLGTIRKLRRRRVAATFWKWRPTMRFAVMYIFRGGFLDGPSALLFCQRYALYEQLTKEKIIELRRRRSGLSL